MVGALSPNQRGGVALTVLHLELNFLTSYSGRALKIAAEYQSVCHPPLSNALIAGYWTGKVEHDASRSSKRVRRWLSYMVGSRLRYQRETYLQNMRMTTLQADIIYIIGHIA
jgi:hypothetical protein